MHNKETAWVTGAGKGLGRAIAKSLAEAGWIVAASSRTQQDLEKLSKECPPNSIHIFPLDVTDETKTKITFKNIETKLGKLDLAIFNAGTHIPVSVDNFSTEAIKNTIEVNLLGVVYGLGQVIPRFTEQRKGHIVVVSSLAGYRGIPTSSGYGATKAALINMCESLKPELEIYNVKLSLISPGFVATPLTDKNTFPMPFIISAELAATIILRKLKKGTFEIAFPFPMVILMKLFRILPNWLLFLVTRRLIKKI